MSVASCTSKVAAYSETLLSMTGVLPSAVSAVTTHNICSLSVSSQEHMYDVIPCAEEHTKVCRLGDAPINQGRTPATPLLVNQTWSSWFRLAEGPVQH